MVRMLCVVFAFLSLNACDSPSVAFMGTEKTIVEIGGSRFAVHRRENKVEVYRTSFEMLPKRAEVFAKAELAIRQATGCRTRKNSLQGDQALMKATLACGGEDPAPGLPASLTYECDMVDGWDFTNREVTIEAIECELVEA